MQELQGSHLVLGKDVSWVWKVDVSLGYSVSSAYNILRKSSINESSPLFEDFWKIKALPSALFIAWRVLGNSIASKANLVRHGVTVDCSSCCLCREEVETTRHLFFECKIAWLVWSQCYAWLGLAWVDHFDYGSHFLHFILCNVPGYVNATWGSVWVAIIGEIWRNKNNHIFKGEAIDHFEIFNSIKGLVLDNFLFCFCLFFLFLLVSWFVDVFAVDLKSMLVFVYV